MNFCFIACNTAFSNLGGKASAQDPAGVVALTVGVEKADALGPCWGWSDWNAVRRHAFWSTNKGWEDDHSCRTSSNPWESAAAMRNDWEVHPSIIREFVRAESTPLLVKTSSKLSDAMAPTCKWKENHAKSTNKTHPLSWGSSQNNNKEHLTTQFDGWPTIEGVREGRILRTGTPQTSALCCTADYWPTGFTRAITDGNHDKMSFHSHREYNFNHRLKNARMTTGPFGLTPWAKLQPPVETLNDHRSFVSHTVSPGSTTGWTQHDKMSFQLTPWVTVQPPVEAKVNTVDGGETLPNCKTKLTQYPKWKKGEIIEKLTKHRKISVNPTRENQLQNQQVTDPLTQTPSA